VRVAGRQQSQDTLAPLVPGLPAELIRGNMKQLAAAILSILLLAGCVPPGSFNLRNPGVPPVPVVYPNPAFVPNANRDVVFDTVVDLLDDDFRIREEQRVKLIEGVVIEGRIDTFPRIGATWLEPHRGDSVGAYNRWESTLQTIRRIAQARIIPAEGGFQIEMVVLKELEDKRMPDQTTTGAASFRHDNTTAKPQAERLEDVVRPESAEQGWIAQGRDTALEQKLLGEIHTRLGGGPPVALR